jgi:hypothetical protein
VVVSFNGSPIRAVSPSELKEETIVTNQYGRSFKKRKHIETKQVYKNMAVRKTPRWEWVEEIRLVPTFEPVPDY